MPVVERITFSFPVSSLVFGEVFNFSLTSSIESAKNN